MSGNVRQRAVRWFSAAVLLPTALGAADAPAAARAGEPRGERTDPRLPQVPWLRDGFPDDFDVPLYCKIPLPGGRTLRLDLPVPPPKLRQWKKEFQSGEALNYFFIDVHNRQGRYRTGPGLTGDELRQIVEQGALPVERLRHVDFIYGFLWQNVRRYYVAYRLSGDPYYVEQLLQYARAMDGVLEKFPQVFIPQEKRGGADPEKITMDMLPYEPAGGSNLMAHAYAALLALQWAEANPRDPRAATWTAEAVGHLDTIARSMRSLLGEKTDPETGLPVHVADWLYAPKRYSPWNQCFMTFSVLTAAAVAMEDARAIEPRRHDQATIDTYLDVVRAAIEVFHRDSDTCIIDGKPYIFVQHGPAAFETGRRVNGHPLYRGGGEDIPHSGSIAWNLLLIYEIAGERVGVGDATVAGLINALVDYVVQHPVVDEKGFEFPPNHFYSPWVYANVPQRRRTREWYGRLDRVQEGYDGYTVFNPELYTSLARWDVSLPRQELFVHYARRVYEVAGARR